MSAARKLNIRRAIDLDYIDQTTPEYLGWLSVQPGWRLILRNPFKFGSSLWHRWLVAREAALGIRQERFVERAQ